MQLNSKLKQVELEQNTSRLADELNCDGCFDSIFDSHALVWLLQAADAVWVHVCESHVLDQPHQPGGRHGLHGMEQRPERALLLVWLMQGRPS